MRGRDKITKRSGAAGTEPDDSACFLGREREARRIAEALGKKESLMISGPADIGKTFLMNHVLRGLPRNLAGRCICLSNFKNLRDLLRKLLNAIGQAGNPALRRELRAEGVSSANFGAWLKATSSSRLKGALYRSIEHNDYRVILDHVPPFTHAVARVVKELFWMRDTPVHLLLRNAPGCKVDQFSQFFYWGHRERLTLAPLPRPVAAKLLEWCVRRFGLAHLDLDEFREEVLDLSGCVPGAIVKMCAMAAEDRYQYGSRIKTKLVHIDYLMGGSGTAPPARRKRH